jgi:hypothetical protein
VTHSFADIDRAARRSLIEGSPDLDGIDFVEVLGDHRTLLVHLLNRAVPADVHVEVRGGVRADPRINPVRVVWAHPAPAVAGAGGVAPVPLPGVDAADRALVDAALPAPQAVRERVLVVRTSSTGDWSTYVLHLHGDAGPPDGFDAPLALCPFSFTVDCETDADCAAPSPAAPAPDSRVVSDYLARDYDALTTRLLDRLSALMPGWDDRNPADPVVMLAELFAHLGDRLAYWQDAVGREAHLGTAVKRTSVRRHARLLNYPVREARCAQVWLAVTTDVPTTLPSGAPASTADAASPLASHEAGAAVFETTASADLHPARNGMDLHTWGDPDHVLPAGARSAYLAAGTDPGLAAGDVLLLVDCPAPRPPGTPAGDPVHLSLGDPGARFAVRLDADPVLHTDPLAPGVVVVEVHWGSADALPVPLRASQPGPDGAPAPRAVALANVVPADHGATVLDEPLVPAQAPRGAPYRPRLARTGLAYPSGALPALSLHDGRRTWTAQEDLIGSGRLDARVVAETDAGVTHLRFGDGRFGRLPAPGAVFTADYRLGGGPAGNVAAGRLDWWLPRADGTPVETGGARLQVWNPLAAAGGTDPEPAGSVQRLAPTALRTQLRAVTARDHADAAGTVAGVQRAVARRVWTGSWYAVQTMVDPRADAAGDPAVPAAVTALLEQRRMVGTDVEIVRPVYVPLLVGLSVCLQPGFSRAQVRRQLAEALSVQGFFHPDRFTFGQALYLSDLVAAAMAVPGLGSVDVAVFARLGGPDDTAANRAAGRVDAGPLEVLRCDTDPNNPEMGRVDLEVGGGV